MKQGSPTTIPRSARRMLRGSRRYDDSSRLKKVQAMARRLSAFVGRLHKDTAEDDLKVSMSAAGQHEPHAYKLKAKNGREFRTSALQVPCSIVSRDEIYNEATWPDGCEHGDWVFHKK